MLAGKNILIGVTGSIAAYKAALLVRQFVKAGSTVKVVMTPCAKDFITTLTFATLSKNAVFTDFISADGGWNNHVELGLWADAFVIAPATANTIAKMANGTCDNLLLATYLSARCPVFVAPAMDVDMFKHPSLQHNLSLLQSYGNVVIPPESGELASGLYGEGRMAEPENIVSFIELALTNDLPFKGWSALVNAGPTYEPIDPVRFIGNHSSGKMGFALAEILARNGAEVTLVTGPVSLSLKEGLNIKRIDVTTAEEMYNACMAEFPTCRLAIMSAAVADFSPMAPQKEKIKKNEASMTLHLTATRDILMSMGQLKKKDQILVGFALETENEIENALAKIHKKHLDLIVLNSLKDQGAGFKTDTNKVTIIDKNNHIEALPLQSKIDVARAIVAKISRIEV